MQPALAHPHPEQRVPRIFEYQQRAPQTGLPDPRGRELAARIERVQGDAVLVEGVQQGPFPREAGQRREVVPDLQTV